LDDVSDGLQKGDTVALVGLSGVGKSYIICRMANACHAAGEVPLIVSMEMSAHQMARRCLALRTGVNETFIRTGNLSSNVGRRAIVKNLSKLKDEPPFYLIDGQFVFKVEDLYLYVKSLNPSAVYVDGAYLLKTRSKGGRYDVIAEAAEQLKIMSGSLNVPVVGTYQFNDEGEIYGSRAIKFLASIELHLKKQSKTEPQSRWGGHVARELYLKKGRFGERGKFRISYNMLHTSIEQLNVVEDYRINKGDDEDVGEDN
jgi:predicted ATP-dependent serine protease